MLQIWINLQILNTINYVAVATGGRGRRRGAGCGVAGLGSNKSGGNVDAARHHSYC